MQTKNLILLVFSSLFFLLKNVGIDDWSTTSYLSLRVITCVKKFRVWVGVCYNSDNHTQPGSSRLIWLVVDIQGGNRTNSANGSHRKRTRKLSNAVGTRGWLGWLVGGDFGLFVSPFSRCHQKKPPMMCPAELQRQRNPWSIRMIPPNLCVLLRGSSGKDDQTRPSVNFSYCTIFLTCPFLFWGDLFWFSIFFYPLNRQRQPI